MRAAALSIALLATLLVPGPAPGQDLMSLLVRGPVVLVENNDEGRFESATAVIHVKAPVDLVWSIISDPSKYTEFMPKLVRSEVTPRKNGLLDVTFEVEVPGPNPEYTLRYKKDDRARRMMAKWVSGDLEGTYSAWRLVPLGEKETLLYYTGASKNFSSMAEALEDEQQTITVGVNVSAVLATTKAVKTRAEARAAAAPVAPEPPAE